MTASTQVLPHILVVVLENREDTDVLGSTDAPYFNQLAAKYGLATASYGRTHPSLPNYLDLASGSTQGITSDCTSCTGSGPTLVNQLAQHRIGWRAYMEGVPGPCFLGDATPAGYAKKHDPFVYFPLVAQDPALCDQIVPYSALSTDLAAGTAPPFLWVTPNLCDDGHDCPTAVMDNWLAANIPKIMGSPWYRENGEILLTFDEGNTDASCCGVADGGHVATVVVSNRTAGRARSNLPVDQAGILATIEDLYGLPHLGEADSPASGNLLALAGGS